VIIRVDLGGDPPSITLVELEVMTQFHVEVTGDGQGLPTFEEIVAGGGMAVRDDHVFVPRDALIRLAGAGATRDWTAALDGMVAHARSKGWTDSDGALQAHVERR
jgi:hypothetical protein